MKNLKISAIKSASLIVLTTAICLTSCNDEYLEEIPKSFLSPENTYTSKEGFESGIANLYRVSRTFGQPEELPGMVGVENDKALTTLYASGTDLGWYWDKKTYFGDYATVNSFDPTVQTFWIRSFSLIKDANVILTRSEGDQVSWESDEEKFSVQAEARFFRALAYRYAVYLFGGVPIIEDELARPKFDFVRSSKDEVLDFIIADLEFATQYLPVTNNRDGSITKAAADHLLAETYISKGDFDKAIAAASRIIDDPQYGLMTSRFGTMTDNPGDVFWDLFRLGNQNHPANTEAIWAWQIEYNVPGGSGNRWERCFGPFLEQLKAPDGKAAILKDEFLGRPVGFVRPSVYLEYEIWTSDWDNDIRNSEYNMKREFVINNPESKQYGQVYQAKPGDTVRNHFVYIQKTTHPYGHPQGYDANGYIYNDIYAIRLAETYLLRAEAYLGKGDKVNAAADINVVRARAQATAVAPDAVDIDYILDERARELVVEEPRRLTLARLGLLDERTKAHNPVSAPSVQEFHNLWPIPQMEIDANPGAELSQNPGYN
jgi:hypothetical protein